MTGVFMSLTRVVTGVFMSLTRVVTGVFSPLIVHRLGYFTANLCILTIINTIKVNCNLDIVLCKSESILTIGILKITKDRLF